MPAAIPVAAAAFGAAYGAAAFTAAGSFAALAAGSGAALMAGATVVGSVLSGVGALTGNERLARVGAVLSLAGGTGTAINKMANPGAYTSLAGDAAGAAAASSGADAASMLSKPTYFENAVLEQANPFMPGVDVGAPTLDAGVLGRELSSPAGSSPAASPLASSTPATKQGGGILDRISSTGGELSSWIKNNPEAAKIYSGLIQGAAKPYLDKMALEAKAEQERKMMDWVRQRYSDSVRNLVIPAPVMTAPPAPGIIQGQRG